MKIVLHYNAGPRLRSRIEKLAQGEMRIAIIDERDREGFRREMADAQVLLHVLEPVTAQMLADCPRLQLIQKIGTGVDSIDRSAAAKRGIAVANTPGANSQAVAEQVLALIFAVLRQTVMMDRATRAGGGWAMAPDALENAAELSGRVVGLVGLGLIPRRLTPVLDALGARWIYHARHPVAGVEGAWRALPALFEEADVVSLHIPSTAATHGLVDAVMLGRMKPGAILINTARGDLVDEAALIEILVQGGIRGAGLDVFAQEPAVGDNPLFALPNVVVSPHVAWMTPESIGRSLNVVARNCRRLAAGKPLLNLVPW